jgi:nucleoid-associated protein YgaU
MTVARLAISLDAELARAVRKAARGQPTSTWIADAARQRLRAEGLLRVVAEWERAHGEISDAELRRAAREQRAAVRRARR